MSFTFRTELPTNRRLEFVCKRQTYVYMQSEWHVTGLTKSQHYGALWIIALMKRFRTAKVLYIYIGPSSQRNIETRALAAKLFASDT
jgi:hypothetical protein